MPNPPEGPVRELFLRVRQGDEAAFEQLFKRFYSPLATYALGFVQSRDAAEDVVQEVFLKLWEIRQRLPDADSASAYLYRAVRNRALNQLRRLRLSAKWRRETLPETEAAPAADRSAEEAELAELIRRAVSDLPPRTREVFLLSREQFLTYPEIAATLSISVKTVETLMGRALKVLRQKLRKS